MKQIQRHSLHFATITLLFSTVLFADSSGKQSITTRVAPVDRVTDIQNFDKRLPPVIPGGEIQLNGRKTRVITTAGPVPVSPAPKAPVAPVAPRVDGASSRGPNLPNDVSVILDNRGKGKRY